MVLIFKLIIIPIAICLFEITVAANDSQLLQNYRPCTVNVSFKAHLSILSHPLPVCEGTFLSHLMPSAHIHVVSTYHRVLCFRWVKLCQNQ